MNYASLLFKYLPESMKEEFVTLEEDLSNSPLYSDDLAPVPAEKRTWSTWHLAFIWVGMAVCIPTYMLAAFMIKSGMTWQAALAIIGLANMVITVPMVLNGHAGVKYGVPFPVLGRASFGIFGIHIASILRALVACGWFGIQTWVGGLAIYAIFNVVTGHEPSVGLDLGQFISFGIFWLINMFFVWKGTESIKWLEEYSAPILILMGVALIIWGATTAGGFGLVLDQSKQLAKPTLELQSEGGKSTLLINPIRDKEGNFKATDYQVSYSNHASETWIPVVQSEGSIAHQDGFLGSETATDGSATVKLRAKNSAGKMIESSAVTLSFKKDAAGSQSKIWMYLLAFTGMVGFWATMSLSIADITRYTKTQKAQIRGQFIGLPGTMMLYSFVGIFVTCAAVVNFQDVLLADDAPWDPVSLISRFESPVVVVVAQIFMLIATLSTNIAANVIAPANAFSNLSPKKISFKTGGTITGIVGIVTCPWWLMNDIGPALVFVSGLLGPVLGIMLADYYIVRKKELSLADLFKMEGAYTYMSGFNMKAMIALLAGVILALVGYFVPALEVLYNLSWFTGFGAAFVLYALLMKKPQSQS